MNVSGGWALVKSTWLSWMQYRSFFFLLAFSWMIPPLVSLFVWSTAAGENQIGGLSRGEFAAYYLVLILVNQFTYAQTNWTVGDVIRDGSINFWLLRPLAPVYNVLATEVAGKVVYMAFVIPISALLAVVLRPELHTNATQAGLFFLALGLAWGLRFVWGLWLALLAFWSTRADALLAVQDSLVFLLSGIVAPVMLLPGAMKSLAEILPFRYMVGFPVEVLLGRVTGNDLVIGYAYQAGWLALSMMLYLVIWRFGLHHHTAVGG